MPGHWRFHRSFRLMPGLRLNLNKRSTSITAGSRRDGPHITASTTGNLTTSVGLPGSGLSYRYTTRLRRVVGNPGFKGLATVITVVTMLVVAHAVVGWL